MQLLKGCHCKRAVDSKIHPRVTHFPSVIEYDPSRRSRIPWHRTLFQSGILHQAFDLNHNLDREHLQWLFWSPECPFRVLTSQKPVWADRPDQTQNEGVYQSCLLLLQDFSVFWVFEVSQKSPAIRLENWGSHLRDGDLWQNGIRVFQSQGYEKGEVLPQKVPFPCLFSFSRCMEGKQETTNMKHSK